MKSLPVFLFFFVYFAASKLELVIEFIRHGARGPSDSKWNPERWGNGFDIHQLTEVGMRQTYILGREMRMRYIETEPFLSKKYNNKELYVRSSASSRAFQSASSHLYGLYPLGTGLEIDQNYPLKIAVPPYQNLTVDIPNIGYDALPRKFQPIEIHSVDKEKDMLLNYANNCPTYQALVDQQMLKKQLNDFELYFKDTFSNLQRVSFDKNKPSSWNMTQVSSLVTNLYADIYRNNPLPEGLSQELWENMTLLKGIERQFLELGTELQRKFMGTPLFKEIQRNLIEKINNPDSELKYVFFSGHYLTLTPLMVGLNITNWECLLDRMQGRSNGYLNCEEGYPIYASQILIELHSRMEEGEKKYFLRAIYNGKKMNLCEKDQKECDFDDFNRRIQQEIIVDNFEKLCFDYTQFESMQEQKGTSMNAEEQKRNSNNRFIEKFFNFLSHADNGMRSSMVF